MEATCDECGAAFGARAGQRFCARRCRNAFHNRRNAGARRDRGPRAPRVAKPRVGTQLWLTDPTQRVCKAEGCMFDAGTCEHGRTKN